jgi:hypothetical protein
VSMGNRNEEYGDEDSFDLESSRRFSGVFHLQKLVRGLEQRKSS